MPGMLSRLRSSWNGLVEEFTPKPANYHFLPERPPRPGLMSSAFATHKQVLEAKQTARPKNRAVSLAYDENDTLGNSHMRGDLTERDRKETLYHAYEQHPNVSICIDLIAKRITSGGVAFEDATDGGTDASERDLATLKQFFDYINDDWDFLQFVRSCVTDILIFGECFVEIVWQADKPRSLHKIDCITMTYELSENGQITKYTQTLSNQKTRDFDPGDIIRWWLPSPRANMIALSPIEKLLNPINADLHMMEWVQGFFRRGAKPPFTILLPDVDDPDEAKGYIRYFDEM